MVNPSLILKVFSASFGAVGGVLSRITPRPPNVSMTLRTSSLPAETSDGGVAGAAVCAETAESAHSEAHARETRKEHRFIKKGGRKAAANYTTSPRPRFLGKNRQKPVLGSDQNWCRLKTLADCE